MTREVGNDPQLNQRGVSRSPSIPDLRPTSGNLQPQVAGNAHGGSFRTTDDLLSRGVQQAAPQGPQLSRPTDLSQCTLEHVGRLSEQQRVDLVYKAFEDGTLFDKLDHIRSKTDEQEILKSLAEACKNISDDRTDSRAKKCCILLLAWAEANEFNNPAPSFDAFIRDQKDDIIANFNLLSSNPLSSIKQKDMLEKLENMPGTSDETTVNGKIFKFVIASLAKPESILACHKWNIGNLDSSEALHILQRNNNISLKLAVLSRNGIKESLLARLSSEDSKTLADRLLSSDSTLLIALIDEGALPNLEFSDKMRLLATEISTIHPAFERGIARGFFGRDSVDASAWKTIVDARENISLQVARKVWQNISNEMARYCFGQDGNIDTNRVEALMLFLEQDSFFTQTPFRYIPLVSHMRSQMHEICERLLDDTNSVRSKLNEVNSFFGSQGASIIQTMSMGRTPPLSYSEAILASLFTPHRQSSLPTCSINSLINEEIFNHPERLVQMYKQILSNGQYTFPSGHTVQPRPIEGGYVTVDLKHGGSGRNEIFKYIKGRDPAKIATQIARWREEGILYDQSSNGHTNYELRLPVHNLNDLLFADLVEASNFGRQRTIGIDLSFNFDTASVYAGRSGYFTVYKKWISVSDTNIQDTISKLQRHAHRQSNSGNCYMRVSTHSTDATSGGGHDHSWHSENLYIKDLIALNLDDLLLGQVYPIGDRNWEGDAGEKNIPQLVVKKVNDTPPSYEFGILRGDSFEKNI